MFWAKFAEKVQNLQKKCKAYKKAGKFTWKIAHFKEKNDQITKNIFKMQKLSSFEFFFIHLHV